MSSFLNQNPSATRTATLVTGDGSLHTAQTARKISRYRGLIRLVGALSLLLAANAQQAAASGSFYYDFAGGVAKYQQTSPFFGTTAQSSTGYGYALNNGIFVNWGGDASAIAFQLGIQHRLSSASDANASYAVQAVYPVMRLQFSRLYLGAGFTPLVWKRSNGLGGVDYFASAKSTNAILAEAGFLMPVTPKFSLGTQGSAQMISGGGTKSPNPIWDATVSMRFYFGFFGRSGGSNSSGEFKGWRYPFGMMH